MAKREENAYILGTNTSELQRLGLQHQVWSVEANTGWAAAGFRAGQTILDLGSGPGFCSKELAYIVGNEGKVIAVDKSKTYMDFLDKVAQLHSLNIETLHCDFDDLELEPNSLDRMYCRWALAWVPSPEEVLKKVYAALKPGGKMVIHEYFDWSTHQSQPNKPALSKAIAACLQSFKEQPGDIDVGRDLAPVLSSMGMGLNTRPLAKMATPDELTWQWPKSFYEIYFPSLVEMSYISSQDASAALKDLEDLEHTDGAHLFCPTLIEIIAEK